jgi:hypothetical protein
MGIAAVAGHHPSPAPYYAGPGGGVKPGTAEPGRGRRSPCYAAADGRGGLSAPGAGSSRDDVTPLVRRYIKTSFVFLVAGLLLGAYIVVAQFLLEAYPSPLLVTAHAHLLLVGFMLMMVMGVATWLFPRPARDDTRYRPELAEAVYWVMTAATATRALAEVTVGLAGATGLRGLIALGGLGQLVGAVLFALNMWWRVRMPPAAAPPSR